MSNKYKLSTQQIKEVSEKLSKDLLLDVKNRFGLESGKGLEDFDYVRRLWTTIISGQIKDKAR